MEIAKGLPANLQASVFVVVHVPPGVKSELAAILSRSGPIPALQPSTGDKIERGRIYVAPPDRHLLIDDGHIELWRGPKENRFRPSVNALFRSAAVTYKERVAGVVLSGVLDDGTTGLWWVKRYGGVTIVQDPGETKFPEMVSSAMEHVEIDHIVRTNGMGKLLDQLADGFSAKLTEQPWKRSRA